MNGTLSVLPFLEVVAFIFLICRLVLRIKSQSLHKFLLSEGLIDQQLILFMHCTMRTLASSLEDFEASSQTIRIKVITSLLHYVAEFQVFHDTWEGQ
jgi:hypothetical protein